MKKIIKNMLFWLIVLTFLWLSVSNIIQAFKCSKMTQTELLINLPNSFLGNWKNCD